MFLVYFIITLCVCSATSGFREVLLHVCAFLHSLLLTGPQPGAVHVHHLYTCNPPGSKSSSSVFLLLFGSCCFGFRIEELGLLSKVEELGLLSKLEGAGFTLSKIEESGLLSQLEKSGALSLVADK